MYAAKAAAAANGSSSSTPAHGKFCELGDCSCFIYDKIA